MYAPFVPVVPIPFPVYHYAQGFLLLLLILINSTEGIASWLDQLLEIMELTITYGCFVFGGHCSIHLVRLEDHPKNYGLTDLQNHRLSDKNLSLFPGFCRFSKTMLPIPYSKIEEECLLPFLHRDKRERAIPLK